MLRKTRIKQNLIKITIKLKDRGATKFELNGHLFFNRKNMKQYNAGKMLRKTQEAEGDKQ